MSYEKRIDHFRVKSFKNHTDSCEIGWIRSDLEKGCESDLTLNLQHWFWQKFFFFVASASKSLSPSLRYHFTENKVSTLPAEIGAAWRHCADRPLPGRDPPARTPAPHHCCPPRPSYCPPNGCGTCDSWARSWCAETCRTPRNCSRMARAGGAPPRGCAPPSGRRNVCRTRRRCSRVPADFAPASFPGPLSAPRRPLALPLK